MDWSIFTQARRGLERLQQTAGALDGFLALAPSVDGALKAAPGGRALSRMRALVEKEKRRLKASTAEDFGKWRSTRDNADYEEYLAAQRGESRQLVQLQEDLDNAQWLQNAGKLEDGRYLSLEELVCICVDLENIASRMRPESLELKTRVSSSLEERDISLCDKWSGERLPAAPTEYESCRLLSARAAEKSAAAYYRSFGEEVTDVSIAQLDSRSEDWKTFDLRVGDRPIDVKNARESFTSPRTYVEHCVPTFKSERKRNADVVIVGVLSEYGDKDEIRAGRVSSRILGETNLSDLRRLKSWMEARFGERIDFDGLFRPGFLPGWIFEYGKCHYSDSRTTVATVAGVMAALKRVCRFPETDIPGWLMTMCPERGIAGSLKMSKTKRKILSDLHRLSDEAGLSRPSLFIYVLGIVLESMLEDGSSGDTADVVTDFLFHAGEKTYPAFLLDTQEYVASLLQLLRCVGAEAVRQKIRFTGFRMPHPSILLGQPDGLPEMRLMAYCGGWRTVPARVKCGATPLVFGQHLICPECDYLACGDCGHCKDGCDGQGRRLHHQRLTSARTISSWPYSELDAADRDGMITSPWTAVTAPCSGHTVDFPTS